MDPNNSDGVGWPNNFMNPFGYPSYHQGQGFGYEYQDPGYLQYDEGNQDGDGEEDFYMDDEPEDPLQPTIETNSLPATGTSTPKPETVRGASTPTAKTRTKDIEAENKLAALRARLIATRNSTPGRDHRAETSPKEKVLEAPKMEQRHTIVRVAGDEQRPTTSSIQTANNKNNVQKAVVMDITRAQPDMPADSERSKQTTGIDELLREGQAAAEATAKEQNMQDLRKPSPPTIAGASEQLEPKKQPTQAYKRPVAQLPYKSSESSELDEIDEKPAKDSSQAQTKKVDVPQQGGAKASTSGPHLSHPQSSERKDFIANNKISNGRAQRMGSPSKQTNQTKEPDQTVYKECEERAVKPVALNSKPPAPNIHDRTKGQLTQSQDQVSQGGRPTRQPADAQRSNADTSRTEPRQQPADSQEQAEMPHQRAHPKPANVQGQNQKSHHVENQQSPIDAKALVIRNPVQSSSNSTALQSKHFNDLDEWLEVTNYHDEAYRHRVVQRHKARKELEIQRAKLEQEEGEDKAYLAHTTTKIAHEAVTTTPATASEVLMMITSLTHNYLELFKKGLQVLRETSPSRRSVTEYTYEREAPYGRDDSYGQYDERRVSSNYRGRGRGRASYSSTNTRGGKYYTNQRNSSRDEHPDVHGLELRKG
ncbi:hypothetical protein B0A49_04203, partial [Cryomyces minteri]